jgi:hypothetical protein
MKCQFSNNGKITLIRDEPEYLWKAGGCLYKEGSEELVEWVEEQKALLYDGRAAEIVKEIDKRLALLPKKGPWMKGRM